MSSTDLNVVGLIRDYALYHGLAFVPLLVVCAISRRRRWLLPFALVCAVASWAIVVSLSLHHLGGISDAWGLGSSSQTRVVSASTVFGIVLFWVVAAILVGLLYAFGRYLVRRRNALGRLLPISSVLVYTCLLTWGMHNEVLGDTVVASGFTRAGWAQIVSGHSSTDVHRLLGAPLPDQQTPAFARDQGAVCWISHQYTGYFACIWFHEGTVTRKDLWFDKD